MLGGSILGDSDGSRLYWNIYQKGLAESASAGIWAMEGTGMLMMEANSTPEQAPAVLKLLRAELDSLLNDGVYEDELRRAKDKWISNIVLSSESTFARMRSLSNDWVTEGRLVSVDEEVERVEKVTTEDVIRALRRFPMREKQVLTALGPLSEAELLGQLMFAARCSCGYRAVFYKWVSSVSRSGCNVCYATPFVSGKTTTLSCYNATKQFIRVLCCNKGGIHGQSCANWCWKWGLCPERDDGYPGN